MKVRKAVIPAAGLGTRFLPMSKAVPKELMPLVDRAAIQYVIEEAAEAGIEQVIVITAKGKEAIGDYFDRHLELEGSLSARGDSARLSLVRGLSEIVELTYVRQAEQLGLGHAVLCAARAVGNEPFAVILPDDIIASERGALSQLLDVYNEYGGSVIAVEEVPGPAIQNYGVVSPEPVADGVYRIRGMVEKPAPRDAPSNLGVVGRYVLTPDVFDCPDQGEARGHRRDTAHRRHRYAAGEPGRLRPAVRGDAVRRGQSTGPAQGVGVVGLAEGGHGAGFRGVPAGA